MPFFPVTKAAEVIECDVSDIRIAAIVTGRMVTGNLIHFRQQIPKDFIREVLLAKAMREARNERQQLS